MLDVEKKKKEAFPFLNKQEKTGLEITWISGSYDAFSARWSYNDFMVVYLKLALKRAAVAATCFLGMLCSFKLV